jgi:uncharacterized repeat protein (TIGR03803 family)
LNSHYVYLILIRTTTTMKKLLPALLFLNQLLCFQNAKSQTMGALYGYANGGDSGGGVIYRYDALSSQDSIIYSFPTITWNPQGSLVQATDGNFYGMVDNGGKYGLGAIFRISPSGSFKVIADFNNSNGAHPYYNNLIQGLDGNLYGMTRSGGSGTGTIFKCTLSGTLTTLTNAVRDPEGSLIQTADSMLYGMTCQGGSFNDGTIFKCTTHGVLTTLVNFNSTNGAAPYGSLLFGKDSNLYGMTSYGGTSNDGTIFKCTTLGVLTTLHSFNGTDGKNPQGSLIQAKDSNLYGMTYFGGTSNDGTIFKCSTSGVLTTLHSFIGTDGQYPNGSLIQASDSNLYGMTPQGTGESIFRCSPSGSFTPIFYFTANSGSVAFGNLIQATDGNLYGMAEWGGVASQGTIFKCTTGGSLTVLHSFSSMVWGTGPVGNLIQAKDGNFYGMTGYGGYYGVGIIFKLSPGGVLTKMADFNTIHGCTPYGGLLQASDGNFYGLALGGTGGNPVGVIFKLTPLGVLSTLASFSMFSNGAYPYGTLIQGFDGNLYGMTHAGGLNLDGNIFKCTLSGTLTDFADFNGTNGSYPDGSLIQASDGNFYGLTNTGGTSGKGTLFRCTTFGTITALVNFTGANGANPTGSLMQATNGLLYGMTEFGGIGNQGTFFSYNLFGSLTTLINFSSAIGYWPQGNLMQASDHNLYGMTNQGGPGFGGTIYKFNTTTSVYTNIYNLTGGHYGAGDFWGYTNLEAMSIKATAYISCTNDSASVVVRGGYPAYTYLWSTGATTSSIHNILSAGTYKVTVKDSRGTTLKDSVVISAPVLSVTSLTHSNLRCNGGNTASASISIAGGLGSYTYSWNTLPIQTSAIASGLSAGGYTVTVTDSASCTITASVNVLQPAALTAAMGSVTNVVCYGGSNGSAMVNPGLGTSPYTYLWSDANTQITPTATGLSAGSYTVNVSDSCGASVTASATITQPIQLRDSISSQTNVACFGGNTGTMKVGVTGGTKQYTYSWTNGATTASVTGLSVGCYTVTVNDSCGSTVSATSCITEPPLLSVRDSVVHDTICPGNCTQIFDIITGGALPYASSWAPAAGLTCTFCTNPTACPLTTTTYTTMVTDANGCVASCSVTVFVNSSPSPYATAAMDTVCSSSSTDSLHGFSPPGGTFSGSGVSGNNFNPGIAGSGLHTIYYYVPNACPDSVTLNIMVETCVGTPGVKSQDNEVVIYPNPNNGVFTVSIRNDQLGISNQIEIYNMLGEKIYIGKINSATTELDLSNQAQGIYLYRMTEQGNLVSEGKFIIAK